MDREKGLIQKNPNIKKTAKDTYREKLSFTQYPNLEQKYSFKISHKLSKTLLHVTLELHRNNCYEESRSCQKKTTKSIFRIYYKNLELSHINSRIAYLEHHWKPTNSMEFSRDREAGTK